MSAINFKIIGCGYIGKKVARSLLQMDALLECYVYSEQSRNECEKISLPVQLLDLDNDTSLVNINSNEPTNEIPQAYAYFAPPQPTGLIDKRMTHFLDALEKTKQLPNKIVLISTTGVYGDCRGEWIDEQRATNPQADRAHRRLSAEQQLQQFADNNKIECIIFRVPGIYALDKLPLKRLQSGEPIVCAADSGYTNRIHADDLAAFCVEALTTSVASGIYNCCDGQPSTMNDYFMRVADALKIMRPKEISLQQAQGELTAGMLSYLAESKRISNKKLLENFKTKFRYPNLEIGLKTIQH